METSDKNIICLSKCMSKCIVTLVADFCMITNIKDSTRVASDPA